MPEITSDDTPRITDNGNYDIINLRPGKTYAIKFDDSSEADYDSGNISIQVKDSQGNFIALDDADSQGIDGTGTTEFQVTAIGTAIRLVAASIAGAAATVDFSCVPVH